MRTVLQVIRDRRSQKSFTDRPVSEDDIRTMLDAAVLAPNHKLTQPWGFAVLGKLARKRYGEIRAQLRVSQEADAAVAEDKRAKIAAETAAVPAVIVVTQRLDGDAHRKREDYAAVFMAVQNILLVATSMGLGSKVHTGDILNAPPMRELVKAEENEQIVALIHLGEPAEEMKPKARVPAADKTRWLP
ncbi:MAG: nitroreductase family protein [Gemmatimonadota bacterium]